MGALDYKTRRHRRNRLAAELAVTYHPRKHFRLGQDVGWHWQFDDPNTLYRRRNRLTYTRDFSNAVWLKSRCSAAAPSGGFTTITEDTSAAASHYWYRTAESAPVGTYGVYTLRVKKSATRNFALWVGSNSSNPIDGFRRYVNLSTGGTTSPIIDGTGVVEVSTTVAEYDATTWLVTCVMQIATGGTAFGILNCLVNGASLGNIFYTGDGASSIQAGYAQLETYTTTPTEYQDVPTTWPQAYLDAVGADRIYAWTDTAGTIPVTAIGDGIGLLLGREYGGARGSKLLESPLASGTGWSFVVFGASASGNQVTFSAQYQNRANVTACVVGNLYELTVKLRRISGNTAVSLFHNGAFGGATDYTDITITDSAKTYRVIVRALNTSVAFGIQDRNAAGWGTVEAEEFSVREIPGTHLTQATGTAKPTLSARVNILIDTELLTAASWTKTNVSVAASPATDPNGGSKAFRITSTAANGFAFQSKSLLVSGATYKNRMFVRRVSGTGVVRFFGPDGSSSTDITAALSTSWAEFTYSGTQPGTAYGPFVQLVTSGDVVDVAFPDCRTADDAAKKIPAYQRVGATAADHDTDGFPHFMEGDGTDNCMASVSTVDGSATDKLSLVAVVTKLSDAAIGLPMELSPIASSNNGSFFIGAPSGTPSPRFRFGVKGTDASIRSVDPDVAALSAPVTAVLAAHADFGAPITALRVNDVSYTPSTGAVGGNFGNYTLYVLSRAGTSLRFNGRFYGSTGRFGPMGDSERNNLTRWWQKRIGTA